MFEATKLAPEASWQPVAAEPLKAVGLLLILLLLSTLSIALPAAGGTKCPAAVSATVITSSCMVSGRGEPGNGCGYVKYMWIVFSCTLR